MRQYLTSKGRLPIILVTLLLIVYTVLNQFNTAYSILMIIWVSSQILVPWMVWKVLRVEMDPVPDLDKREFGYADRPDLNTVK